MGVFGHRPAETAGTSQSATAPDLQALRPIQGARILLVEDNTINQQVATEILQQAGFIVEVAADGAQALAMLGTQVYDAVLMDIQMPVMDGYTATTRIREQPRWNALPVLAMTANVLGEDRAKASQVGMNDHIAKPIVAQDLFAKLLRWIPHGQRPLPVGFGQSAPADPSLNLPAQLPGIDLPKALLSVAGNRALLRKLLLEFAKGHGDDDQKLQSALVEGDLNSAQRLAHTLKGVSGSIGAIGVQQRAGALDAALKAGRHGEYEGLLADLRQAFEPVREGLLGWAAQVLRDQEVGQGAAVTVPDGARHDEADDASKASRDALMSTLEQRLRQMDFEAADTAQALVNRLARLKDSDAQQMAAQLHQQAQDLDFDQALETLKRLQERLA
jgi:two-component system sensor histidine kinase/response regulator